MAFRVEIAPRALADLDDIADYIALHGSHEQAGNWFNSMIAAIASLKDLPNRCRWNTPIPPSASVLTISLRRVNESDAAATQGRVYVRPVVA